MTVVRTIAPAKINWTLEVLGRREDGYHEIRSVMQTIDLCDEVEVCAGNGKAEMGNGGSVVQSGSATLLAESEYEASEDDLTLRAMRALEDSTGRQLPTVIRLKKRIPVGAGLGGGSSDAAAVLRCVDRLWDLGLERERLVELGSEIGSDVAFFLHGGTALAEGRGERIGPLPDAPAAWLVMVVPPIRMADKTKRTYGVLATEDYGDGSQGMVVSQRLNEGKAMEAEHVHNVFDRAAYEVFEGLETYREVLLSAGAEAVHLAGAGPALFALAENEAAARGLAERVQAPQGKVFVSHTLSAREATALVVSE